jgi:NhaA family Na+:H+ antiporter
MSIFIAGLAYDDDRLLAAAKLSVLCASTVSALVGLLWGLVSFRKARSN